jgi:AraC-like DNA-binding protein
VGDEVKIRSVGSGSAFALHVTDSARLWRYHHEHYCITLTLAGSGRWRYRHRDADVSPASLMLMEPGEVHSNTAVDAPGTFLALFVPPEQVAELSEGSMRGLPHFQGLSSSSEEALDAMHALLASLTLEGPEAQDEQLSLALTAVMNVAAECKPAPSSTARRSMRRAAQLLEERYRAQPSKKVDVREVAAELSMNYHWFVHCFSREFGLAPYQFVKTLRMCSARMLMKAGPSSRVRTLGDLALEVGYADAAHMHREFNKDCGVLPSALAHALNSRWQRPAMGGARRMNL